MADPHGSSCSAGRCRCSPPSASRPGLLAARRRRAARRRSSRGLLVSLSSTAIVLKLLGDRGATGSAAGQTSLGAADLPGPRRRGDGAVLPVLGGDDGGRRAAGGTSSGRCSRRRRSSSSTLRRRPPRACRRVLEAVARACSPEVFLLSVIALCLGTAYLTALAGVSVSLGAFLAGLVVSESRHSRARPRRGAAAADPVLRDVLPVDRHAARRPLPARGAAARPRARSRSSLVVKVGDDRRSPLLATGLRRGDRRERRRCCSRRSASSPSCSSGSAARRGSPRPGWARTARRPSSPRPCCCSSRTGLAAWPAGGRALARRGSTAPRTARGARRTGAAAAPGSRPRRPVGLGRRRPATWPRELTGAGVEVVVMTLSPDGAAEAEDRGCASCAATRPRRPCSRPPGSGEARVVVVGDDEPEQAARIAAVLAAAAPRRRRSSSWRRAPTAVERAARRRASTTSSSRTGHGPRAAGREAVLRRLRPPAGVARPTVVDTDAGRRASARRPTTACVHASASRPVLPVGARAAPSACARAADWVHLRLCTSCGHVGCCDSSPGRHAAAHAAPRTTR